MNKFISTLCYSGLSPIAPGTFGSIVALILILPLAFFPQNISLVLAFVVIATVLGFYSIPKYLHGRTDDLQEIVIDEAAGLYTTILLAMVIMRVCGVKPNAFALFGVSFVMFRVFDITKPLIIGYYDRTLKGATGIMVDDILAGLFAGITTAIFLIAFHTFK